jgi:succinoglycan biosynthesis protein ExoL
MQQSKVIKAAKLEDRVHITSPFFTSGEKPCLAFFGHDSTDWSQIKRIRAFQDLGVKVLGYTFRRGRFNRNYLPEWEDTHLGVTEDRRYGLRLLRLIQALPTIVRRRREFTGADAFYARNVDMCILALFARWLARSQAPLAYEVMDVQRAFTARGMLSALLRGAERWTLRHADLLVVSSPAFVSQYFAPVQGYKGPFFLLENKLTDGHPWPKQQDPLGPACPPGGPWVIAWLGTLRCPRSPGMLRQIAAALGERVRIHIHGFPIETGLDGFLDEVRGCPNIIYYGEYRSPDDLQDLYGQAHFSWVFDYLDTGTNSAWLLPNRLYEGCYFGVPALAAAGTETGRRVGEWGCGWTFEEPVADSVLGFIERLEREEYLRGRRHLLELPARLFRDDGDMPAVCRQLGLLPQ